MHSSKKEKGTHVKSWLKFAKSIELVRCMTATKAAKSEQRMVKNRERTRVSPRKKDLCSLVDDDTGGSTTVTSQNTDGRVWITTQQQKQSVYVIRA